MAAYGVSVLLCVFVTCCHIVFICFHMVSFTALSRLELSNIGNEGISRIGGISVLVEHYRSYYVKWPFKFVCFLFSFVHVQRPPQGFKLGRPPMRTTASIFRIRTKQFILGCPRGSTTLRAKRSRTAGKQHEHKLRIRLQIGSPVVQIRVYTCNIRFANFAK